MDTSSTRYPNPIIPGKTRISWIGVGVMGAAMAARVQTLGGHALTLFARTPSKAHHLLHSGAVLAPTPAAAALHCDILFLMLSHPSDVRTVVLDPADGVLSSLSPNAVLVDMTSSNPSLARKIAAAARSKKCFAIDAPVSGGDVGAREGRLAIFAGGDAAVVEWVSAVMGVMGRVTRVGAEGCGQSCKIANQIAAAGSVVGVAEALVFAERVGLEKRKFVEAARGGMAGSGMMELFGERMAKRDFEAGGFVEYMVKDLGMGLEGFEGEGEEGRVVVMPGARLWREMWMGMVANGEGRMGLQGIVTLIERINGIEKP